MQHRTDLQFRYECPETEALWRVSCQIEMQNDDTNNPTLGVTLYEVTDPNGNTFDIYAAGNYPFRLLLEAAALEEFWSRAERACQKTQHSPTLPASAKDQFFQLRETEQF